MMEPLDHWGPGSSVRMLERFHRALGSFKGIYTESLSEQMGIVQKRLQLLCKEAFQGQERDAGWTLKGMLQEMGPKPRMERESRGEWKAVKRTHVSVSGRGEEGKITHIWVWLLGDDKASPEEGPQQEEQVGEGKGTPAHSDPRCVVPRRQPRDLLRGVQERIRAGGKHEDSSPRMGR